MILGRANQFVYTTIEISGSLLNDGDGLIVIKFSITNKYHFHILNAKSAV